MRNALRWLSIFALPFLALSAFGPSLAHAAPAHGLIALGSSAAIAAMGTQTLGNYNETFFAQESLIWLEKALGMAGRVYRGYDPNPKANGDTIQLRRPTLFTAADAPATATDLNPDSVSITLNKWKEAKMVLTDKELSLSREKIIEDHVRPMAYALADQIDQDCAALYKQIPWISPLTSASAPLLSDITAARLIQFGNKVPLRDGPSLMHAMCNGNLEAGLLNKLTATTGAAVQNPAIAQASMGTLYGYEFFSNQNTPNHTSGIGADSIGTVDGINAVGAKALTFSAVTAGITFNAGDTFSIAGDAQRYVISASGTDADGATVAITFTPGLAKATAGTEVLTIYLGGAAKGQNLLFHRNAFALAMAPLSDLGNQLGAKIATVADPVSNLTLRSRMFYDGPNSRVYVSVDALYGVAVLDPNLAIRVYEP